MKTNKQNMCDDAEPKGLLTNVFLTLLEHVVENKYHLLVTQKTDMFTNTNKNITKTGHL